MSNNLTPSKLAYMLDQTLLKVSLTEEDLIKLCNDGLKYGFKTVAVNAANVNFCANMLKGSIVGVDSSVSFPLGQCTLKTKLFETENAIESGATEVDYVINIYKLKNKDYKYMETEMREIAKICAQSNVISKAIFEICYLTNDEIETMSKISLNARPDFIKTATGFGPSGATVEAVRLMKACVGDQIKVKASGGIRTLADTKAMINAGADRLGTSCGMLIVDQLRAELNG